MNDFQEAAGRFQLLDRWRVSMQFAREMLILCQCKSLWIAIGNTTKAVMAVSWTTPSTLSLKTGASIPRRIILTWPMMSDVMLAR